MEKSSPFAICSRSGFSMMSVVVSAALLAVLIVAAGTTFKDFISQSKHVERGTEHSALQNSLSLVLAHRRQCVSALIAPGGNPVVLPNPVTTNPIPLESLRFAGAPIVETGKRTNAGVMIESIVLTVAPGGGTTNTVANEVEIARNPVFYETNPPPMTVVTSYMARLTVLGKKSSSASGPREDYNFDMPLRLDMAPGGQIVSCSSSAGGSSGTTLVDWDCDENMVVVGIRNGQVVCGQANNPGGNRHLNFSTDKNPDDSILTCITADSYNSNNRNCLGPDYGCGFFARGSYPGVNSQGWHIYRRNAMGTVGTIDRACSGGVDATTGEKNISVYEPVASVVNSTDYDTTCRTSIRASGERPCVFFVTDLPNAQAQWTVNTTFAINPPPNRVDGLCYRRSQAGKPDKWHYVQVRDTRITQYPCTEGIRSVPSPTTN